MFPFAISNSLRNRSQPALLFCELPKIRESVIALNEDMPKRSLRPAVIHRKLTFGTQSDGGSRFLERIMTVTETCRRQKRSSFEYLVQAMTAYFHKTKAPSLIPSAQPP